MKKRYRIVIAGSLFCLVLFARSGRVTFLKTRLLSSPDVLAAPLAELKSGDQVDVLEEKNGYALVRTASGNKGYVNLAALQDVKSKGITGVFSGKKGVSDKEVAEGAKGWNPEVEKKVQGSKGFDFAAMEWVAKQSVPPADIRIFVKEGKIK